jgi:hypothetical protein
MGLSANRRLGQKVSQRDKHSSVFVLRIVDEEKCFSNPDTNRRKRNIVMPMVTPLAAPGPAPDQVPSMEDFQTLIPTIWCQSSKTFFCIIYAK